MTKAKLPLALWLTLAASLIGSVALASNDYEIVLDYKWTAPARVLNFPNNVAIGTITMQSDWHNVMAYGAESFATARGKIVIARDKFVKFQPNGVFFRDPKLISQLPANAIDCLELKLMSMEDSEDSLCDRALGHIGHLKGLKVLILDKSEVTDQGVKQIVSLTNLEYLSAFLTPLRGTCLKDLRALKNLKALAIPCNGLVEDELKYLPEYPALQHLLISRTNLTNKGMKYIGACTKLKRLDLSKNPGVTDESLPYLKQLKDLKDLSIDDTSITYQGLLKLKAVKFTSLVLPKGAWTPDQIVQVKASFPHCHIVYRGGQKQVDDVNKTLYGPMSRQRHF